MTPSNIFHRSVVGIDRSDESLEAARQALRLAGGEGDVALLTAWALAPPLAVPYAVGTTAVLDDESRRLEAVNTVRAAALALKADVTTSTVRGLAWQALIDVAEAQKRTLIAVGSHGDRRLVGIIEGSTLTEVVHKAPCSVLVARAADETFPRKIVVGIDGSRESAAAYAVANTLSNRFGAELWPVVAWGGHIPDKRLISLITDRYEELPDHPVRALTVSATDADLIVVGSRGLHGLKALGSVSERVAHEARCSTLIVR